MCEECVSMWKEFYPKLRKWWPDLEEEDNRAHNILFRYTGYPSVYGKYLHEQIAYLAEHGPEQTLIHINEEMDREWAQLQDRIGELRILLRRFDCIESGVYWVRDFDPWNPPRGAREVRCEKKLKDV